MNNQQLKTIFEVLIPKGSQVKLIGSHPHAGKIGTFSGLEEVGLFRVLRPKITFEDGAFCFVMKPDQWQPAT
jgi:hypothetical protein